MKPSERGEESMKIKTRQATLDQVLARPRPPHRKPLRPLGLLWAIIRVWSAIHLALLKFTFEEQDMARLGDGPYLILMNHSSFIDLEIAHRVMKKRFNIVCTSDGFVGKNLLMRLLGCIPTKKFVTDLNLMGDMRYALKEKKTSVLLYPEASYSFDGTATPLPRRMGLMLKRLEAPVVSITTYGAFTRDPLYNGLQIRKSPIEATVRGLLTAEEIKEKTVEELDAILDEAFSFDQFAWQRDNGVEITECFRADGLSRILYRCAACGAEGKMEGKGEHLRCHACGKKWYMLPSGQLKALEGETEFSHIPDWYRWERQTVRAQLEDGSYCLDIPVRIGMLVDTSAIYFVGEGRLRHDSEGFTLSGCDGKLSYTQPPQANYGLYADYYWYEIGDTICIGNQQALYYCFPLTGGDVVAKTRLATEELYKMKTAARQSRRRGGGITEHSSQEPQE